MLLKNSLFKKKMYSLIDRLRRNTASVTIKGRVVMFTDGKCNSKRVLDNEDDENTNPLESMQDVRIFAVVLHVHAPYTCICDIYMIAFIL